MQELSRIFGEENTLGHFYIVEGNHESVFPVIKEHLTKRKIEVIGNPSVTFEIYETFGVDEAKFLRERERAAALEGAPVFFIISTLAITREAEQALLKTFEEPLATTHFFLVVPKAEHLTDTVRSRGETIRVGADLAKEIQIEAKDFITATKAERLNMIKKILAEHEDDDSSGKVRDHARTLISGITLYLRAQKNTADYTAHDVFIFDELLKAEEALSFRGASPKLLLEHIALVS